MENTIWQQWADRVNKSVEEAVSFINTQKLDNYKRDLANWEIAAKQAKGTNQQLPVKPPPPYSVVSVEYDAGMYTGLLYVNNNGPKMAEIITQFEKDLAAPLPASGNAVVGDYMYTDLDGSVYYIAGAGDTATLGQIATAKDGSKVKATMVPMRPFGRIRGYVKVA